MSENAQTIIDALKTVKREREGEVESIELTIRRMELAVELNDKFEFFKAIGDYLEYEEKRKPLCEKMDELVKALITTIPI